MVKLRIDGIDVEASEDSTILEVAKGIGIDIPTFCHSENLAHFSGCRICVVEVEGSNRLLTACSTKVQDGMVVQTESEKVVKVRKDILELLWANHPEDCLTCNKSGECKLQEYCYRYEVRRSPYKGDRSRYTIDDANPFFIRDQNKCILCGRCVAICKEVQVTGTTDFIGRGHETRIAPGFALPYDKENCRFCGQCISECPTGALMNKQFMGTRPWEIEKKVTTTCPFCGTGCQFDLNVKDGKVVGVTPNPEAPVNGTSMCVKGRFHTDLIHSENRLTRPLIKRDGVFIESSWEEAMALVSSKLRNIRDQYGPDAIAGLSSARCVNEDNFVFQKMMRVAIGTNNVDHCART